MSARIILQPAASLIDQPVHIVLTGFAPATQVTVTASSTTNDGNTWKSRAVFLTDDQGKIDVATTAPVEGDYAGIDGQGLIWSQQLQGAGLAPAIGAQASQPISTVFKAIDASGAQAQATLSQSFSAPGVVRTELNQDGLVGALYTPASKGPHPAIVYLNGSGGGVNEARAALLASHGYAALALGYFGAPGLPSHISATPLEYFERALTWLRDTVGPADGFIAVSGQSRGGELSLLLASTFSDLVSAVVAYVPSPVVHGVLAAGKPGESRYAPAWTHKGRALATIWDNNTQTESWARVDQSAEPRRQAQPFVDAQSNTEAFKAARIPVERIRGPVLLISGGDDGYWPSSAYADNVAEQLRAHKHPHAVEHAAYPKAGHSIAAPHVPTTQIARAHAVSGVVLTAGGTPAANAHANSDSWARVLKFLDAAVKSHQPASQAQSVV